MEREYFQNELTKSSRHIHTASPFVRSSGLPYLQEVGELTALAPHTSSRSNLPSYLFFIVTDGAGSFKDHSGVRPQCGQPSVNLGAY